MKSKYLKILISLILVVSLCLAMVVTQSYAIPIPVVVGGVGLAVGGIAWALANAMGVDFALNNFTAQTIDSFINPFYQTQSVLQTSDFTIVKGLRTGYDALRLSLTAFQALKAGAENIITDEQITDNTTGQVNYKSAYDCPLNTPILSVDWSTTGNIPTPDGGYVVVSSAQFANPKLNYYNSQSQYVSQVTVNKAQWPVQFWYINDNNVLKGQMGVFPGVLSTFVVSGNIVDKQFNYVAGTIDTNYGDDAQNYVSIIVPENPNITVQSPLADIAEYLNNLAIANNPYVSVEIDDTPVPPQPTPIPTDALGDIPFNQFVDIYGGSVFEKIDEQTQVIDIVGQSVGQYIEDQTEIIDTYGQSVVSGIEEQTDVIDTVGQSVVETIENQTDVIDTVGQDVVDAIESVDTNIQTGTGILIGIRSIADLAFNTLEHIGEMVEELVEDIVLGTETLISGILNQIPSLFNVILSPIKRAASIWHYVVEWIQSIGAPFQFIWSMASGTSYYIILPVYASLAAAVVLAFYKRFGK